MWKREEEMIKVGPTRERMGEDGKKRYADHSIGTQK